MTCTGSVSWMASGLPWMQREMEANISHHGKTPDEIEWSKPELQTFALKEDIARGIGQLTK